MEQLKINDIWHGKEGTLYENVSARGLSLSGESLGSMLVGRCENK
ncbi:hypothetical protein [Shimazuella kribbensis]|nr:hypothetical protein [Shimazuella kribbensis]